MEKQQVSLTTYGVIRVVPNQTVKQLLEEIIEDLVIIYNTRKKNRESSADIVQALTKYQHKLKELEDK